MFVLCALTAIGPFSMDVYTPALPQIRAEFGVSDATVQATITMCLVGLALGQLVLGPLSDALGRRFVLFIGVGGWILGSALCLVSTSIWLFDAGRILQGFFGGAGVVVARAVLADRLTALPLVRGLALLSATATVFPVIAPVIGGLLAARVGWRADFVLLVVVGAVLAVTVSLGLRESLPPERRHAFHPAALARSMAVVARRGAVRHAALVIGAASLSFFAYVASSTFVVQEVLGASQSTYVLLFATNAAAAFGASMTYRRVAHRIEPARASRIGGAAMTVGGAVALAASIAGLGLVGLWCGMFVFAAGWGVLFPSVIASAQAAGRDHAGATSALLGVAQYSCGALGAPLTGLLPGSSALPFAAVLLAGSAVALTALMLQPGTGSTTDGRVAAG